MKKISTFVFLILALNLFGQSVTNIDYNYDAATEHIKITYDLNDDGGELYWDIGINISIEGKQIDAKALSGDFGKYIKVGESKLILWDVFEDMTSLDGDLSINVLATPSGGGTAISETVNPANEIPKPGGIPAWASLGSVFVVGAGLLTTGAINYSSAKSDWELESNLTTSNPIYDELNTQSKKGQYMLIGGSAIVLGGVYMFFKRKKSTNNLSLINSKKEVMWTIKTSDMLGQGLGVSLVYHFN